MLYSQTTLRALLTLHVHYLQCLRHGCRLLLSAIRLERSNVYLQDKLSILKKITF